MRKILFLCCIYLCTIATTQGQDWLTDFDKAKKIANENNRKIILVFQGSDWNGLCIRLNKEMWSNSEFLKYAKEHYVMLKADFPRRKENLLSTDQQDKNNKLADLYNFDRTLPLVAILNKNGELLGTTGYKKVEPYKYIELLNFFKSPE
jgi:thioredoxin-related protein